ncbi:MAG: FG-GAP-like repeat-containing protein, partial [bacterium]
FRLHLEGLERREVLSGATVQMYPGSLHQTELPYANSNLVPFFVTYFSIGSDINDKPFDFNGDGSPDLLNISKEVINLGGGVGGEGFAITPLLFDGFGKFTETKVTPKFYLPGNGLGHMAAVLDWNGDGYQDYLSAITNSNVGSNPGSFAIYIMQNDGKGNFQQVLNQGLTTDVWNSSLESNGNTLLMKDFNGDGAPDILLPGVANSKEVWYLYNGVVESGKWNGKFDTTFQALDGVIAVRAIARAADLNGDGKLDIITPGAGGANIFINNGAGQFTASPSLVLPSIQGKQVYSTLAADFNNDGKVDIAAAIGQQAYPAQVNGQVTVYLNNTPAATTGNPSFDAPFGGGGSGENYSQLVAADMNLDGYLDIVSSSSATINQGTFFVLPNDGTGHFSITNTFIGFEGTSERVSSGIGIADWNNDGQLDVTVGTAFKGAGAVDSNRKIAGGIGLSYNDTFQPPAVTVSTLPPATAGVPYSYQLQFKNGDKTLPYSVSISPTGNNLPAGLTLSPTGLISGTPTQSGAFQPLFYITQSNGLYGRSLTYLNVSSSASVAILPGIMPNAVAGLPFQQQLTTTLGPANWVVTAGALPSGLSLSQGGLISGTPMALGTYSFSVLGTGSGFQSVMNYQMLVQPSAAPVVTNLVRYGYHAQPTTLVATFSQPLDATSAGNVANYVLTSAGADGRFGTRDDKNIPLASASYNTASNSVTLRLVQKNIPLRQLYRLGINGTPTAGLQNTGGIFLGGQGVGAPGTNYVQIFSGKILAGPNNLMKTTKKAKG